MFNAQSSNEVSQPNYWAAQALCNDGTGVLAELFFSEQLDDIAAAKQFCQGCPVKASCLDGAMARREPWGVWGGELFFQGKVLAQKRKRGRPPKVRPVEAGFEAGLGAA